MRLSLLTALAAALALPALAQPALPDSADAYVSPTFGIGHVSSQGTAYVVGLDAGRRLGSGVDVGFRLIGGDATYGDAGAYLSAGPTVGLTRHLPGGVEADVRALGLATFADLGGLRSSDGFGLRTLRGTAQATLGRPVRLVGSLQLVPTVGAYATACTTVGFETAPGAGCAEAGALAGAELRFRLFGADVSIPLVVPIRLAGNDRAGEIGAFSVNQSPVTGGIRVRF